MARWDIAMEPFFVRPMMSQWCPMSARPCRFPRRRPPNKGPGRASETGSTWKKPMALEKKNRFQDIDQIGFFLISTSNLFLGSPYTTYPFLHMSKWFGFDTIAQRCLTCQGRLDPDGISQVCSTQPDSSQNPFSEILAPFPFQNIHSLVQFAEIPHPTPAPACCGTPFDSYAVGHLKILQCKSLDSPLSCWQLIWIIAWKLCVGRSGGMFHLNVEPTWKNTWSYRWNLGNCSRSFFGSELPSSKFAAPVCTWCMFCRMVLGRNDCCFCRTGSIVRYEAGGSQWWDSQNWTTELALLGWGVKSWEVVIQSIGLKQPSCSTAWQLCWNELQKNRSATEVTLVFLTGIKHALKFSHTPPFSVTKSAHWPFTGPSEDHRWDFPTAQQELNLGSQTIRLEETGKKRQSCFLWSGRGLD